MGDGEVKNHLRARPHEPKREVVNRAAYGLTSPLQGERGGILQTANNYLAETLSNIRQERTFQPSNRRDFVTAVTCFSNKSWMHSTLAMTTKW